MMFRENMSSSPLLPQGKAQTNREGREITRSQAFSHWEPLDFEGRMPVTPASGWVE
jgi:hypothetical protein